MSEKSFVLKLPEKVHTSLKIWAVREGKAMQELINDILKDWLDK
jgi:predicted HicB family RNase H-like nuclease